MADFVGDEKRLFERRAGILMQDQPVAGDEYRTPAVKQHRARSGRLDVEPTPLRFGDGELIRPPGIGTARDRLGVKPRGNLPGELNAIHVSPLPRAGARAFPGARRRLSGRVRRSRGSLSEGLTSDLWLRAPASALVVGSGGQERIQRTIEAGGEPREKTPRDRRQDHLSITKGGDDLPWHVEGVGERTKFIVGKRRKRIRQCLQRPLTVPTPGRLDAGRDPPGFRGRSQSATRDAARARGR